MNFKTIKYHLKVNKEERILLQYLMHISKNASLNILRKSNPNLECIKLLRGRGLTIPTRIQINL